MKAYLMKNLMYLFGIIIVSTLLYKLVQTWNVLTLQESWNDLQFEIEEVAIDWSFRKHHETIGKLYSSPLLCLVPAMMDPACQSILILLADLQVTIILL